MRDLQTPVTSALALACALVASSWSRSSEAASFRRGPYLQDLGSRQVAVLFELDAPHSATLTASIGVAPSGTGPGEAGPNATTQGSVDTVHELVLTGLTPATSYRYTVAIDDGTREEGTFTTAPEDDRPFSFLAYGDNRTDAASHASIVAAMKSAPGDFIVQTGDMVQDGSEPDGWTRFFLIERELLRSRCVFPAIGNHEVSIPTSDGAQRFARMFRVPGPSGSAERYYTFRWGSARFVVLDSQDDFVSEQRAWLEKTLVALDSEAGITWRFVVLHNGPFSSGLHGPNRALQLGHVPELLRAHKIDLVLAGHDHIYERGEVGGLKYLISGGGGAPLYPEHHDEPTAFRFEPTHHFIQFSVSKGTASMKAVRMDGSTIEECTLGAGGNVPWGCPGGAAPAAPGAVAANATPPPSPKRACDCSFAYGSLGWTAGGLVTALIFATGLRRKTRLNDPRKPQEPHEPDE